MKKVIALSLAGLLAAAPLAATAQEAPAVQPLTTTQSSQGILAGLGLGGAGVSAGVAAAIVGAVVVTTIAVVADDDDAPASPAS